MGKTGLVVEGGGMKCAYNAGILDRFLDENIHFDYCIGVSAGSANVASYLAGQRDRNLRFYTQHTTLPEYMGVRNFLRTGQFFGLQFIYGTLTNTGGADPIDYPAIMANPSEYELVATDAGTGEATYFNKYDLKQDDDTAIMASCALPALCRPVSYNGHLYYDGGVADSIPVERAFAQGCDRVVVILSNPRSYVKQKEGLRFAYAPLLRKYPKLLAAVDNRHLMYRKNIADVNSHEKDGSAFVFAPTIDHDLSAFCKDAKTEQELYDLGVQNFNDQLCNLKQFLQLDTQSDSLTDDCQNE